MKLKTTFSGSDKRMSVFYCPEPLEISPNELTDSDGDKLSPDADDMGSAEECVAEEETPTAVVEVTPPLIVGSLGTGSDRHVGFAAPPPRPDNLPLVDEYGNPVPPPRHKKKLQEKRDQRLLSVPNIKFNKPEVPNMHDLRDGREQVTTTGSNHHHHHHPQPQQQASFTGNLMRRFSKCQLCAVAAEAIIYIDIVTLSLSFSLSISLYLSNSIYL